MPDTLLQKVNDLSAKVDTLTQKVNALSDKSVFSLWTPILAALVTALVGTLLAQMIDRIYKNRSETSNKLSDMKSKCLNAKIRLKGLFRQLASFECDSAYWYHVYKNNDGNDEHGYAEHISCENQSKETLKTIEITMAEFLSEASKYEKLNNSFNIEEEKQIIDNIEFPNKDYYKSKITLEELENGLVKQDKEDLKALYLTNIEPFEKIIEKMA